MASWFATSGNNIPDNAVRGGYEPDGRPLYVAKAKYNNLIIPGKAAPHLSGCLVPYDGKEHIVNNFEVLVLPTGASGFLDWRPASGGIVPEANDAFYTDESVGYYVARATQSGSLIPGKIDTMNSSAYVTYGGKEYAKNEYEVLYRIK